MVGIFLVLQLSSARTNESWVFVTDDSFDDLTARTIASEGCIRLNKISFVLHWESPRSGQWPVAPISASLRRRRRGRFRRECCVSGWSFFPWTHPLSPSTKYAGTLVPFLKSSVWADWVRTQSTNQLARVQPTVPPNRWIETGLPSNACK